MSEIAPQRPGSKLPDPKPAPVKRVMAPAATIDRTHLYEKPGPSAVICIHARLGFCIAMTPHGPLWSHGPGVGPMATRHPDWLRVAFAWAGEGPARADMMAVTTLAEWTALSFTGLRCDVAESPQRDDRASVNEMPLQYPSLEACQALHGGFPLRPEHMLDKTMRRSTERAQEKVSLAPTPSTDRRVPA